MTPIWNLAVLSYLYANKFLISTLFTKTVLEIYDLFIYLGFLWCFQHCTGHITTGSWKGRGNQYIQFIRVVYCKLQPTATNYQLSHLRQRRESNPGLRGGRRECYHSATVDPCYTYWTYASVSLNSVGRILLLNAILLRYIHLPDQKLQFSISTHNKHIHVCFILKSLQY